MKIISETDYDAYLMGLMEAPDLQQPDPNDEGHIEDHSRIAETINDLAMHPAFVIEKTGDNAWKDAEGGTISDADLASYWDIPSNYLTLVLPRDWSDAASAPVGTQITILYRGHYGLISQLGDMRMRISRLEDQLEALTNPE